MGIILFGEFIYEKRKKMNLTATELAKKAEILKSDISKIENNRRSKIQRVDVENLCTILEIDFIECEGFFKNFRSNDDYLLLHYPAGSFKKKLDNDRAYKSKVISELLSNLIEYNWDIQIPKKHDLGDLIATDSKVIWHIKIWTKYIETYTKRDLIELRHYFWREFKLLIGHVAIYEYELTKFSIVVVDENLFYELLNIPTIRLNVEMSYIYLNLDNAKCYEVDSKTGKRI